MIGRIFPKNVNFLNLYKVNNVLKKLLNEPLVHFLVLGGLLFLFYFYTADVEETENSIVISQNRIEQLTKDSEEKLLSILTEEEKQKLVDQEIYETILYKEALKIGLDKNDADMRSHLAKKMEFVLYDTEELPTPSDEVLEKFMIDNPKDYRQEAKITFTQSLMNPSTEKFEKEYTLSEFEASNIFGRSFSEELFKLEEDEKPEKIESDYGIHEVYITSKMIPKLQVFEKVKEQVKEDYLNAQRAEKNKVIYEAIKSEYSINIEKK